MNDSLRDRLDGDDALARALGAAVERAEAGDGTVAWADVGDDVPAEQWGRLLETGLLVDAGDGFVVDDPDAAREYLAERDLDGATPADGDDATDADSGGWTTKDKAAGVFALSLMASYQIPGGRETIGSTVHLLLGPVEAALPFGATVALLAVATTLLTTTLRRRLADTDQRERVQERMETVKERLQTARERGDEAAVERLQTRQQELMYEQLGAMKSMLRPMVWTMLVTVPIFLWLSWLTVNPAAAITPAAQALPLAGRVVWTARLVGPLHVWTVWYIVCSLVSGVASKRVANRVRPIVAG